MQPKTDVRLDNETFDRLKKTIKNMSRCSKAIKSNAAYATPLPEELGLQLTNRCNLRCKHCYEWSERGFNWKKSNEEQKRDLSFEVIEKVFRQTESVKSNLFLWGGEPLVYNAWDEFVELLERDPRWTVLCTNGTKVEEKIESLIRISSDLAILTSLEGFEDANDNIRGKGSYKKVMQGMDLVLDLIKKGEFKGVQSIHSTISDKMVGRIYDYLEYFEAKGLDTVYINFPWYIPKNVAERMDDYYKKNFDWVTKEKNTDFSWHSYGFFVPEELIDPLVEDLKRVNKRDWKIRVRYQPAVEIEEVVDFVTGTEHAVQKRRHCLAKTNRMDILTTGEVSCCKLFSEFAIGNLHDHDIQDLWHCDKFRHFREVLHDGLMPVCSKCAILYLNGR